MFTSLKKKLFGNAASKQGESARGAAVSSEAEANASEFTQRGNALREQGRLQEAAQCYRQALAASPYDIGALVNLGFVLSELEQYVEARSPLQKAALLDPKQDDALYILGTIERATGNQDKAIEHFGATLALRPDFSLCRLDLCRLLFERGFVQEAREVVNTGIAIDPNSADLHYYLGNLHNEARELDEAVACFQKALALQPNYAPAYQGLAMAHSNLGTALQAQGKFDAAAAAYRRALELRPDHAQAHCGLASVSHSQGRLNDAIQSYKTALSLQPDFTVAWVNLGNVFQDLGALPNAIDSYQAAIALEPTIAEAHNNLATALQAQGKLSDAVTSYETAIELKPNYAEAHCNLGTVLAALGDNPAAITRYRLAISMAPDYADAHSNLGNLLQSCGQLGAAHESYTKALSLTPDSATAHRNLGGVFQEMGEHDAAIESLQHALTLKPDCAIAQFMLLFTLNYHPDKSAQEIFAAYRDYDQRVGLPLRSSWREHGNSRDSSKRLKVGYVSPDFRQHAVRHFLEPLLAHHDKRQVEVFAYAELSMEDAMTARYRGFADHWVPTVGLTDEMLAERIRADEIDILIDLAGQTAKNRLGVFARKPAPVSMSWLGFGYTTGLSAIDYMLTDSASTPEGSEDLFAEQPWRLTTPGYAYRPANGMGHVSSLPAQDRGFITFGTLTRSVRINHRSIRVWSQILHRLPGARLVVDSSNYRDESMRNALLDKFSAHGIGPERLELGFHSPPWDVLRGMDIGLDCFPHNSGTTLFESLYMGVPYVTLAGRPSVGRLGSSILQGVGHPEWIADSEDEYVELAVALASDLPKLAALRAGLRAQMQASAVMDEPAFARKLETAYREMFSRWAEGSA